jgi:hypothetical protein
MPIRFDSDTGILWRIAEGTEQSDPANFDWDNFNPGQPVRPGEMGYSFALSEFRRQEEDAARERQRQAEEARAQALARENAAASQSSVRGRALVDFEPRPRERDPSGARRDSTGDIVMREDSGSDDGSDAPVDDRADEKAAKVTVDERTGKNVVTDAGNKSHLYSDTDSEGEKVSPHKSGKRKRSDDDNIDAYIAGKHIWAGYAKPLWTFGLEYEFCYAVRQDQVEAMKGARVNWHQQPEKRDAQEYIRCKLNLNNEGTHNVHNGLWCAQNPRDLMDPETGNKYPLKYDRWILTEDSSIGADYGEWEPWIYVNQTNMRRYYEGPGPQPYDNQRYGMITQELVSPPLYWRYTKQWNPQIKKIAAVFDGAQADPATTAPNPKYGKIPYLERAMMNMDTGLHVHVGWPVLGDREKTDYIHIGNGRLMPLLQPIDLQTVKNTIILYANAEASINRLHPGHRINNTYCQSLRRRIQPWDALRFAQDINAQQTVYEVKNRCWLPSADGNDESRYVAVAISDPHGPKPLTLEFRQHRGAYDSREVIAWLNFCVLLVAYAHKLAYNKTDLCNAQILRKLKRTRNLFTVIEMHPEDVLWFEFVKAKYDVEWLGVQGKTWPHTDFEEWRAQKVRWLREHGREEEARVAEGPAKKRKTEEKK